MAAVSGEYRMYPSRWGVLATTFILSIANNLLWITFSPVATTAAEYYDKSVDMIDLLSSIGFIVGMPFCILSSFIVSKLGLKFGIWFAVVCTFFGGVFRMFSSFPSWSDTLDRSIQFWLAFVSMVFTGVANPMVVSIATKVNSMNGSRS